MSTFNSSHLFVAASFALSLGLTACGATDISPGMDPDPQAPAVSRGEVDPTAGHSTTPASGSETPGTGSSSIGETDDSGSPGSDPMVESGINSFPTTGTTNGAAADNDGDPTTATNNDPTELELPRWDEEAYDWEALEWGAPVPLRTYKALLSDWVPYAEDAPVDERVIAMGDGECAPVTETTTRQGYNQAVETAGRIHTSSTSEDDPLPALNAALEEYNLEDIELSVETSGLELGIQSHNISQDWEWRMYSGEASISIVLGDTVLLRGDLYGAHVNFDFRDPDLCEDDSLVFATVPTELQKVSGLDFDADRIADAFMEDLDGAYVRIMARRDDISLTRAVSDSVVRLVLRDAYLDIGRPRPE